MTTHVVDKEDKRPAASDVDFVNQWYMCKDGEWYRFLMNEVDLIPPDGMYEYLYIEKEGDKPDPLTGEWVGGYDLYSGAVVEDAHNLRRIRIARPVDVNVAPKGMCERSDD